MKKETDNRLLEWTINKAKTEYKDKVCLMLELNTYTLPEERDVRHISRFVTNSKQLIGLAKTFIIDGIGYDHWQNDWEALEILADVKGYLTTSLLDTEVVYYKSDEDKQRFLYLQAKLRANLANPKYMYERGLEWLDKAMDLYKTLMFEDNFCKIRKGAGFVADYLSIAVACVNQQYLKRGMASQIELLSEMESLPENFIAIYKEIIREQSASELKNLSHDMIATTRDFFKTHGKWSKDETNTPDYNDLAAWYQESCYYFRRLYHYCSHNMPEKAFNQCINLQVELDDMSRDFNIPSLDLLSLFNVDNMIDFITHAKAIEQKMVSIIEESGVTIESYPTVEDFLQKNL